MKGNNQHRPLNNFDKESWLKTTNCELRSYLKVVELISLWFIMDIPTGQDYLPGGPLLELSYKLKYYC